MHYKKKFAQNFFQKNSLGSHMSLLPHTLCGFENNSTSDSTRRRTHNHWVRDQVSNHSCYVDMSVVLWFFYTI